MRTILLSSMLLLSFYSKAQSVIKTVNSGSLITPKTSVSIGEIIINPTQNQSNSGIIGILAQVNQQQLEVAQFELSKDIVVYPNPTVATIYFKTSENISNELVSVYNNSGQLILQTKVATDNSLNLNELSTGIYLIQFSDKKFNSFKIIKH
jgi:hypothetical protein